MGPVGAFDRFDHARCGQPGGQVVVLGVTGLGVGLTLELSAGAPGAAGVILVRPDEPELQRIAIDGSEAFGERGSPVSGAGRLERRGSGFHD